MGIKWWIEWINTRKINTIMEFTAKFIKFNVKHVDKLNKAKKSASQFLSSAFFNRGKA